MKQVAALPYEIGPTGELRLLLITSRQTRRWVIPKGNPMKGLKPHQAAEREAFEEAGLTGVMSKTALGRFRYSKHLRNGDRAAVEFTVFPMRVTGQLADWPERGQRTRRWLDPVSASHMADDAGLRRLILIFDPDRPLGGSDPGRATIRKRQLSGRPTPCLGTPRDAMRWMGQTWRRHPMIWTLAVILVILWLLGFVAFNVGSGLIHLLLVLALIVVVYQLVAGRRGV